MPFRLFRIPVVALRYILNHMSKVELLKISLCSRKADRALKRCGKTELSYFNIDQYSLNRLEHLELSLLEAGRAEGGVCTTHRLKVEVFIYNSVKVFVRYNVHDFYSFHVVCLNKLDRFSGVQKGLMMKDTYIPVVLTRDKEVYTFWNNRADGMIFLLKCLNEKFRYVTHQLRVLDEVAPDSLGSLRTFVGYTNSDEVSLSCVCIGSGLQKHTREFQYILENAKFRRQSDVRCEFFYFGRIDDGFKFNGTISCSKICISFGHWITLQYLLKCKHEEIKMTFSKFTNEEIKTYINQWVAGAIPDVQKICVDMKESFKWKHALSGLQRCRMSENVERDNRLDHRCVFIRGAGDKVAEIGKCIGYNGRKFNMQVYYDPYAVDIEEEDEESDVSEVIFEDEEEDEDMEEDEEESEADDEDEEEEESDGDENMEEDGEEDDQEIDEA